MEIKKDSEKKTLRCAIYTRVSTTDNLEKDFTSLDSQRESAESYIASQKSEGWIPLSDTYNDAGFTGANTERPALQKLIADIKMSKIDCVIVYKVDRLSRSLLDFTQLLEFFDENKVAFVSVTQHFNTNTSMGRLTLNILLSFAQFEREIISERTRDKMGAARKKGKWIGGVIPLGYDLDRENHRLVINPEEAKLIKEIFASYIKEKSVLKVAQLLNEQGYVTKQRNSLKGKPRGGLPFTSNSIALIIKSATYTGRVHYHGQIYPGDQSAIIDDDTYNKAQEIMKTNVPKQIPRHNNKKNGLLNGIMRCKACNSSMYIAYCIKNQRFKYNYYVCSKAQKRGRKSCPTRALNAGLLERKVVELVGKVTKDKRLSKEQWEQLTIDQKIPLINSLIRTVNYDARTGLLEITFANGKTRSFDVPVTELKKVNQPTKEIALKKEPQLRQNLLLAHQAQELLNTGKAKSLKELSGWLNLSQQRLNQVVNLVLLCPKIQEEILLGNSKKIASIPEYKLRPISEEISWEKQLSLWETLSKTLSK